MLPFTVWLFAASVTSRTRRQTRFNRAAPSRSLSSGERAGVRAVPPLPRAHPPRGRGALLFAFAVLCFTTVALRAEEAGAGFEAANKFYEQGRFAEAAAAYEKLLQNGPPSDTLYFNLGNSCFKAGQLGRAIAAYRQAERLAPRDPSIRFNLQFARKKITGSETPPGSLSQRAFTALTLNEWAVLTSGALWLWFTLLALREFRPALRRSLNGYTATAGVGLLLLAGCFGVAANLQLTTRTAVVIAADAIARTGPLDEAKVLHQFRDGVEVTVLDEQVVTGVVGPQTWLQIRDATGRTGWMKSDQLVMDGLGSSRRDGRR